jgi:hypothetical protein
MVDVTYNPQDNNYYLADGTRWGAGSSNNDKSQLNVVSSFDPPANPPVIDPNNPPPTTVVPGKPAAGTGQVNVADYAAQLVTDPSKALTKDDPSTPDNESMFLQDHVQNIDANAQGTNITAPQQGPDIQGQTTQAQTTTAQQVDPRDATTYDAAKSQDQVEQNGQATAQQGQVDQNHLIDAPQEDVQAMANGQGPVGQALNDYAKQNLSNIIDTSTPSGKALAEALGDGNYVDSKATLKGQLDTLQSEFVDADGNPKIPGWAAATARNVSKIAAFKGMSGTAATAAMAQALMEASIPVAQQDAQFFQTLTLKNLDNKQQATINKANVLANFEMTNLDNRMTAAVENSKAFLQMDMANLDNKQQAEILNTQSRVQSILEDSKQENAARLFAAQSQQDMDKFYDSLNSSIQQFNAAQSNGMAQFNAGQDNDMSKFNADLENNRDQFYKNMQYNVDTANAKWRQTVTLQDNANQFEAAATDVKTLTTISQEQLNQIWDRSDALLDYAWKSSENDLDRKASIAMAKLQSRLAGQNADKAGLGSLLGTIAGKGASSLLDWAFG